ncbi:hypothetical protein BELL_1145g00010 [Botrytis elliptica]|uniref:Uncharacterized protein n=1 Tax=Botrytis elliptica TaxID=278938 RepID=A0A4Z1IR55_9HELO|nr:hypothetical protein BELL_1145g00010 [Botrytis elliptica]
MVQFGITLLPLLMAVATVNDFRAMEGQQQEAVTILLRAVVSVMLAAISSLTTRAPASPTAQMATGIHTTRTDSSSPQLDMYVLVMIATCYYFRASPKLLATESGGRDCCLPDSVGQNIENVEAYYTG